MSLKNIQLTLLRYKSFPAEATYSALEISACDSELLLSQRGRFGVQRLTACRQAADSPES